MGELWYFLFAMEFVLVFTLEMLNKMADISKQWQCIYMYLFILPLMPWKSFHYNVLQLGLFRFPAIFALAHME